MYLLPVSKQCPKTENYKKPLIDFIPFIPAKRFVRFQFRRKTVSQKFNCLQLYNLPFFSISYRYFVRHRNGKKYRYITIFSRCNVVSVPSSVYTSSCRTPINLILEMFVFSSTFQKKSENLCNYYQFQDGVQKRDFMATRNKLTTFPHPQRVNGQSDLSFDEKSLVRNLIFYNFVICHFLLSPTVITSNSQKVKMSH